MSSHPITAGAVAPLSSKIWALPEHGLAVFHGHADAPRLFHYFLPRLIAQGKSILCLDGANRFDPLLIAKFARERGQQASVFNNRLRVARAFTCFQLTELLVRVPRLLRTFSADVLIVTALPDLHFDEDVREREAAVSFRRALEALHALQQPSLATSIFCDATSFQTPRRAFFAQLVAQADCVSRFITEDNRLALISEKSTPQISQNVGLKAGHHGSNCPHICSANSKHNRALVCIPAGPATRRPRAFR
jgi:hypothetical protein